MKKGFGAIALVVLYGVSVTAQQQLDDCLVALVKTYFVCKRNQSPHVTVAGQEYDLTLLWIEEPWTTKAACVKSVYKYLAQQEKTPTLQTIKDIFSSTFRFFDENDKAAALLHNVYNLGCVVLRYAKEESTQFQFANRVVLHTAQLLQSIPPEPSLLTKFVDEIPYWSALFMATLTGITLRHPVLHMVGSLFNTSENALFVGDLVFSALTASMFVACGAYASYLLARNKMLSHKNSAYEQNNCQQPDANEWEMSHTGQEAREGSASVCSAA
jgi:hypothetical protein